MSPETAEDNPVPHRKIGDFSENFESFLQSPYPKSDAYDECKRSALIRFSLKLQIFHKRLQIFVCLSCKNPSLYQSRKCLVVPHAEAYIERTLVGGYVDVHSHSNIFHNLSADRPPQ